MAQRQVKMTGARYMIGCHSELTVYTSRVRTTLVSRLGPPLISFLLLFLPLFLLLFLLLFTLTYGRDS